MSSPTPTGFVPLSPKDYLDNPGYLKLDLMLQGLQVGASAMAASSDLTHVLSDFGSGGDLDLLLPEDTWVSAPWTQTFAHVSPYFLVREEGEFFIRRDDDRVPVKWYPPGEILRSHTTGGVRMSSFAVVHGSYLALAPNRACSFLGQRTECKFCSAVLTHQADPRKRTIDDVLETVEMALRGGPIRMVYLAMGYTDTPDHGIAELEPFVRAIKRNFDVLVGVDCLPPETDEWIDRTYAMGVDALSYNIEVWDPIRFQEVCPGLHENLGRDRFLSALSYAAGVFPRGAVGCHLIVGLDDPSATCEGIDWLTERSIVPILPLFRPFKGIDLREKGRPLPTVDDIAPVYGYLYQSLKDRNVPMGWVRDISVVTTPVEGRFFVGEEVRLKGFLSGLINSGLGRRAAVSLSDLRRSLRVREV